MKQEVVDQVATEVQSGMVDALKAGLGKTFDAGKEEGKSEGQVVEGTFTQADIDAARAEEQAKSAEAVAKVQADLDLAKSDDAADHATIAAQQETLAKIAVLIGVMSAPLPTSDESPPVQE